MNRSVATGPRRRRLSRGLSILAAVGADAGASCSRAVPRPAPRATTPRIRPGPPADEETHYRAEKIDLRLDPGSQAVDAKVALPNFNDRFSGKAPDPGCCELGAPLPHYGPRP